LKRQAIAGTLRMICIRLPSELTKWRRTIDGWQNKQPNKNSATAWAPHRFPFSCIGPAPLRFVAVIVSIHGRSEHAIAVARQRCTMRLKLRNIL
jgi:hypothetical protein